MPGLATSSVAGIDGLVEPVVAALVSFVKPRLSTTSVIRPLVPGCLAVDLLAVIVVWVCLITSTSDDRPLHDGEEADRDAVAARSGSRRLGRRRIRLLMSLLPRSMNSICSVDLFGHDVVDPGVEVGRPPISTATPCGSSTLDLGRRRGRRRRPSRRGRTSAVALAHLVVPVPELLVAGELALEGDRRRT